MDESLLFVAAGGVGRFPVSVTKTGTEFGVVFRPIIDPIPTVEIVIAWDLHSLNPLVEAMAEIAGETRG